MVDTAGVDTAGVDTAGVDTAGVDTAGVDTAGVDTAGVDTAGVDTAGVDTAGWRCGAVGEWGGGSGDSPILRNNLESHDMCFWLGALKLCAPYLPSSRKCACFFDLKSLNWQARRAITPCSKAMSNKVLILDDEQDLLDTYRELLTQLPSKPDVHTATSGARALALLESEPFSLMLTDLNMPGMDGFQVLTIVRRRFPSLRTVVMTSVADDQYRARAYAMGIDLFMEKPKNEKEIALFSDCVESLLGREDIGGFRGVQSKSLVDLIQMECLSQSTSVLKITNGPLIGKIWVENGDVIDAEVGDFLGEDGFKQIVAWRSGTFEILPPDPTRERRIMTSYSGLLLDSAQSIDEGEAGGKVEEAAPGQEVSKLSRVAKVKGVEFLVSVNSDDPKQFDTWGLENPAELATWTHEVAKEVRALAQKLNFGTLNQMTGTGPQMNIGLVSSPTEDLCVGINRSITLANLSKTLKEASAKWAS